MQDNRLIGFLMIGLGVLLLCGGLAWGVGNLAEGMLQLTGFLLLAVPLALLAAVLVGGGVIVVRRAAVERGQYDAVARQRKVLGAIQAQGQLSLAQAALETNSTLDQLKADVYDLVGKGLFSGYIDWNGGMLYARQARELREKGTCPNCGGQLELSGKGVIRCPYCGSDIFL